jgi:hypothetical protein
MIIYNIGSRVKKVNQKSKSKTPKKEKNMSKDTEKDEIIYNLSNRVARSTIAVIDTVSARGGFKGEELSTIGQLRDQCTQMVGICESRAQEETE